MKTITKNQNNVIECTCGTVIEYDKSDLILKGVEKTDYYAISVVCPACGKVHTVKPAEFDSKALIGSINDDKNKKNLNEWTISEISILANSPYVKKVFAIHDRINITLKNGYNAVFEIIGIEHDIRKDGKKAGLTFCLVDLYGPHDDVCVRKMNDKFTNEGGFDKSDMLKWLNGRFFALLPDEWQKIIVPVIKKTADGGLKSKIVDTTCKVFIPSEVEIFGKYYYSREGEGEQYEGFKNWKDRIKGYPSWDSGRYYWLRSPYSSCDFGFCIVNSNGSCYASDADNVAAIAPCFAI